MVPSPIVLAAAGGVANCSGDFGDAATSPSACAASAAGSGSPSSGAVAAAANRAAAAATSASDSLGTLDVLGLGAMPVQGWQPLI